MVIGVDVDGVLVDDDRYQKDNKAKFLYENGLPPMEFPTAYENKYVETSEENKLKYRHTYFFDYFKVAKPHAYAREVLKKLSKKHKIVIITARYKVAEDSPIGEKVRRWTRKWLKKHGFNYEICFTRVPKIEALKKYKVDVMIDDSPQTIPEMAKVTHVFCFDVEYNEKLAHENVTRVYSWYDLLSKFESMFEK